MKTVVAARRLKDRPFLKEEGLKDTGPLRSKTRSVKIENSLHRLSSRKMN